MISRDDIIGMSGLDEAEVDALSEHEHLDEMAAAAFGAWLLHERDGARRVAEMIRDDIRRAWRRGDRAHARELFAALHHFLETHGPANPPQPPREIARAAPRPASAPARRPA